MGSYYFKLSIVFFISILLLLFSFIFIKIRHFCGIMATEDTFGRISISVDRLITKDALNHSNIIEYIKDNYPRTNTDGQQIKDYWGNPIRIDLTNNENYIILKLKSSGVDGVYDTKDDIRDECNYTK